MARKRSPHKASKQLLLSRRGFLKSAGLLSAAYWLGPKLMIGGKAYAQIPGGTLPPGDVPKYLTPLLIPPVMPKARTVKAKGGQEHRLLRDRDKPVQAADPAGRSSADDGVGLRRGRKRQGRVGN